MYPFQNILFTTDFSSNSKSALKYAAAFAHKHGATLYIHNSQEGSLPPQALKISDRALAENGFDWVMAIKREMEEIASSELLNGLKVQMILSEGNPAKEIPRVINDYKIDLATMATSSRINPANRIGAVSLAVMAQTSCPILYTHQSMHDFVYYKGAETSFALNRILFATDFSESDNAAKDLAIELARAHQAQLLVVHSLGAFLSYLQSVSITDLVDVETRVRVDAQLRLAQIATQAGAVSTETLLTEGRSYEEILRVAGERDIDLIVVGTGRMRNASHPLPGRNAERVVRGAPCAVLTVRNGTAI
jgi:nucleotide-binding universal stress UspA family protein